MAIQEPQSPGKAKAAMKTTVRRKRSAQSAKVADSNITTFSSDLLTPEEERELLTSFWDVKSELVRVLVRHFPSELRAVRPPLEPWPMAQFIREHCIEERCHVIAVRRLRDR
jgi:RNA polymerase primary sigma factor